MSLYVDSSAFLKRYIDEPESERSEALMLADPQWITGRHTSVEVRRNLSRLLKGTALERALDAFAEDWKRTWVVELDERTCELACEIAESTGARTLDALHLAAATRVGASAISSLTWDLKQAQAARALGISVRRDLITEDRRHEHRRREAHHAIAILRGHGALEHQIERERVVLIELVQPLRAPPR